MHLLIVLFREGRGDTLYGGERTTLELAKALSAAGARVDVVQWHASTLPVEAPGLALYRIEATRPLGWLRLGVAVAELIKQTSPDTVYAYAEYFPETLVAAVIGSLLTGKRLVVSVLDDQQRAFDRLSLAGVFSSRLASRHSVRTSLRFTVFQCIRRLAVRTLAITVVSTEAVAAYARDSLKAVRVVKIGRGVDEIWFGRNSRGFEFDAICVGGLWEYKRVDVLISAWKDVTKDRPDAKLLIVGEGNEFQKLQALAANLGVLPNVTFKGYLEDAGEVHGLLSKSRIFVSPSGREGYGRAAAEAAAAGLPCVLSDIPVFRELYSDTAILVEPGEPALLAQAILELLTDHAKYDEFARRTAAKSGRLSWEAVAKRLLSALSADSQG